MTYREISSIVASIGLPYAYYQFPEGTAQPCPYIVFFFVDTDDLYADDSNYQSIPVLNIELYTDNKDFALEALVESTLKKNGLTYYKEENYIDTEKMYQIAYEMEVVING